MASAWAAAVRRGHGYGEVRVVTRRPRRTRWPDLSPRQRSALLGLASLECALTALAATDL